MSDTTVSPTGHGHASAQGSYWVEQPPVWRADKAFSDLSYTKKGRAAQCAMVAVGVGILGAICIGIAAIATGNTDHFSDFLNTDIIHGVMIGVGSVFLLASMRYIFRKGFNQTQTLFDGPRGRMALVVLVALAAAAILYFTNDATHLADNKLATGILIGSSAMFMLAGIHWAKKRSDETDFVPTELSLGGEERKVPQEGNAV